MGASPWLIPFIWLPVLVVAYWTSVALYDFLRAYRSWGDAAARASTLPIEPTAFEQHLSNPVQAVIRTPAITLGTLIAALRRHSDADIERLRRRYLARLVLLLAIAATALTILVLVFR